MIDLHDDFDGTFPFAPHTFERTRPDGTVVEVNLEDAPFLLDSVSNEVQAHGLQVVTVVHPVIGVERRSVDSAWSLTWDDPLGSVRSVGRGRGVAFSWIRNL